jgi:ubiquinol-cytochrome c reductase iron-sulfur subunit
MNAAATIDESHGSGGKTRRDFLYLSAGAMAAVGTGAVLWPLIDGINPAADILAQATVEVDLGPIQVGQHITVKWRGQPLFIDRRTPEQIAAAWADDSADCPIRSRTAQGRPGRNGWWLSGSAPNWAAYPLGQKSGDPKGGWGGWFCSCHGSHYDTAGRIRRCPAPRNLVVPPYAFLDDARIQVCRRSEGCSFEDQRRRAIIYRRE